MASPNPAAKKKSRIAAALPHSAGTPSAMLTRSVGRLARGTTRLFVCDVQERFRDLIHGMPEVVASTKLLVQVCGILGVPTIVSEQYPKAMKHTVEEILSVLPVSSEVYEKKLFSMVAPDSPAAAVLPDGRAPAESVILCGIEAHVCVLQTALDLMAQGVEVHVVTDAVSSQRVADRETALRRLERSGAFLTTSESVAFQLLRTADDPDFKACSKLCVAKARAGAQMPAGSKI
jgi:nicotinamidase-related amidase